MSGSASQAPHVELLWWSGCPSHPKAKAMLKTQLLEAGLNPDGIESLQIVTAAEAASEHFVGSPTIRIDGLDIVDPGTDAEPALTCRLYFLRSGRPSALPDPEDLRSAIARSLA